MDYTKLPYWNIFLLGCLFYGVLVIQPAWYWFVIWFCTHFIIVTFGIHFTFHRLLSHKAFTTTTLIERIGSCIGCLAMSGSPLGWAGTHIHHHAHSDTDKDPHPPSIGWKNIFGFINNKVISPRSFTPVAWMRRDPFHNALDKYYFEFILLYWLLIYWILGYEALFFLGLLPTSTAGLAIAGSNNVVHKDGEPINNYMNWFLVFGEAAHADHHTNPRQEYLTRYHDPTGFMIKHLRKYK